MSPNKGDGMAFAVSLHVLNLRLSAGDIEEEEEENVKGES